MGNDVRYSCPGYVYVFRDRLDNNLIKVGLSQDPIRRQAQLYRTSNPLPMSPYCVWRVDNMELGEKAAHVVLEDHRINPRREFFQIAPPRDFNLFERTDYDMTSTYLDCLLELIEDGMDMIGVSHCRMNSADEIVRL